MARVLATGATGFIGAALVAALSARGMAVRAASRRPPLGSDAVLVPDLGRDTDWRAALADIETIVHLAGPAHAAHPEPYLRRAIVEASEALARQAETAGAKRLIFVSSIKAAAAHAPGRMLSERDPPKPGDAYGRAKLAAEQALLGHTGLSPVILRPPLVFAPNAKANFAKLLRVADTNAPLPFAGLDNRRSLISLASFIEAILAVLAKPDGACGVFHLADQPALSTPQIIDALRCGLGRPPGQFRLPGVSLLAPPALTASLAIDDARFRAEYGYGPRGDIDVRKALEQCARDWKAAR